MNGENLILDGRGRRHYQRVGTPFIRLDMGLPGSFTLTIGAEYEVLRLDKVLFTPVASRKTPPLRRIDTAFGTACSVD